jgi:O-antigen/teichoic acid export membrane protein
MGVSQAFGLIVSVVTARFLGQEGFGELGIVLGTLTVVGNLAGLGSTVSATRRVAELRASEPDRVAGAIGAVLSLASLVGLVAAAAVFGLAPFVAAVALNAPHLTDVLRLGSVLVFANALGVAQSGVLSGFEAFRRTAIVNLMRGLLNLPLTIAGVWMYGLPGAVGAAILVATVGSWLSHRALRVECRQLGVAVSLRSGLTEIGGIWRFSVPAFLMGALPGPVAWIANVILVHQPNGHVEMSPSSVADQRRMAVVAVPTAVGTVSLPLLSNLYGSGDRIRFARFFWQGVLLHAAVAGLVALPVIVLSSQILSFYGPGFAAARGTVVLLAVPTVLSPANAVVGNGTIAAGPVWWGLLFNLLWGTALLSCWRVLASPGTFGLALAYVLAYSAPTVWQLAFLFRLRRNRP